MPVKLPPFLQGYNLVALDFESYYDSKSYSLRRQDMSTSLYVRDERFKTHTVAFRQGRQRRARWFKGDAIERELDRVDWANSILLCHHTHFDGLILSHHYGHVPAFYADTLSMARALHGNHIDNALDTVAQYYGRGAKTPDVLAKLDGIRDPDKELLAELGYYNANDVDIMYDVFADMLEAGYPEDELRLIDMTVSLFTEPVLEVDRDLAEAERVKWKERKEALQQTVIEYHDETREEIQTALNEAKQREAEGKRLRIRDKMTLLDHAAKAIGSNERYADMLRGMGVTPPTKPSPSDHSKRIYAFSKTDLDFQALQAHPDEQIRNLVEARLATKSNINETRAAGLLARSKDGMKLPAYLNYCGAHTMRWSGGDSMNIQNFPDPAKGTDSRLRECLVAPRGMHLVVVDSAQIEARVIAWLCGQTDKLEAFADPKRDPYCEFATDLYNYPVTKDESPTERFVGKVCELGLGFGMGPPKLQYTLATGAMGPPLLLDMETCEKAVDLFRYKNNRIQLGWRQLQQLISSCLIRGHEMTWANLLPMEKERILMPNGLDLMYPNIRVVPKDDDSGRVEYRYKQRRNEWSKIYGGLLSENATQCIARIIIGLQALPVIERYRMISLSHDELIYLAPKSKADDALEFGLECLRQQPADWAEGLPLDSEGAHNRVYLKP